MLGRETKLGTRLECLAGLPGRAGASNEVEFPREIPGEIDCAAKDRAMDATERTYRDRAGSEVLDLDSARRRIRSWLSCCSTAPANRDEASMKAVATEAGDWVIQNAFNAGVSLG
jgi:hypothetical protein